MNHLEEPVNNLEEQAVQLLNKYRNNYYNSPDRVERDLAMAIDTILPMFVKLEKRATPMKPLNYGFGYSDVCPTCNASVTDDETDTKYNFCQVCGQALGESETK